MRYADEAVFFFKKEDDAKSFMKNLNDRCHKFGLILNEDKTKYIDMSRALANEFDFLGLTFYWGKQGSRRILKVKTQKAKLSKSIQDFDHWMNGQKINHFYYEAIKSLYKWLNRRSQKRSYNWSGFKERIKNFPLMLAWEKLKLKKLDRSIYVHK